MKKPLKAPTRPPMRIAATPKAICEPSVSCIPEASTTLTSGLVRLLMWNMPYHAEHHLYPSIPFHRLADAHALIGSGVVLWLTNVLLFSVWYWQLDGGGPTARRHKRKPHPDFLFVQMSSPEVAPKGWVPSLVDYLYLSFTNSTAFSPTDTMPLTSWAKLLMMIE